MLRLNTTDGAVTGLEENLLQISTNYSLYPTSVIGRKEGNVLFNDALNTFYLRLFSVGHMVKLR